MLPRPRGHTLFYLRSRKFTFTSRGLRVSVFPRKFPRGRYGCINNTGVSVISGLHVGLLATLYIPSMIAHFFFFFFFLFSRSSFRPPRKYIVERASRFYFSIVARFYFDRIGFVYVFFILAVYAAM